MTSEVDVRAVELSRYLSGLDIGQRLAVVVDAGHVSRVTTSAVVGGALVDVGAADAVAGESPVAGAGEAAGGVGRSSDAVG